MPSQYPRRRQRQPSSDDSDVLKSPTKPAPKISRRTRLAYQFRRGHDLDDDCVGDHSFPTASFSLGSTHRDGTGRGDKFLAGFSTETDVEVSRVSFNYDRRWIYVHAEPTSQMRTPPVFLPLEAEIPFEDIVTSGVRAMRSKPDAEGLATVTLTVVTRRPARFYVQVPTADLSRRATDRDFVFNSSAKESTAGRSLPEMVSEGYLIHEAHAGPIEAVTTDPNAVQANSLFAWQFTLRLDPAGCARFREKILGLNAAGHEDGQRLLYTCQRRMRVIPVDPMPRVTPSETMADLDFRTRYLIEGLITHGLIVTANVPALRRALDTWCPGADLRERVLTALFNEERIHHLEATVALRSKRLRDRAFSTSPHSMWVYRCTVTPTRLCLMPPQQEASNEALRQHNIHLDRFLRVTFADENDRVQVNQHVIEADAAAPADGTLARVRRALNAGIRAAGRHYVFLAYGASTAREHTCWFVAEDPESGFTAQSVRNKLGFWNITERVIAKHAARMGLLNVCKDLPDIYVDPERREGCSTDGVGQCGQNVAREAARALGLTNDVDASPSALQIRCGGIKGVLSVWPELCKGDDVRFRSSQITFKTDSATRQFGLSVVRVSQFHHAFLNRQFIILLEYLGVPAQVFEDMFTEAIELRRDLADRMVAGVPRESDIHAADGMSLLPLKRLFEAGFNRDPLFMDICQVLETHLLHLLKWKNRLEIKKGVHLLGIADELGVLGPYEVFCQYENPKDPDEGPRIVTADCAVMRAPTLHPGDIQKVRAVDHPRLRHLKNVIVFSVKGKPVPSMVSGGDLDGDDFALIWDERLVPPKAARPSNEKLPRPVLANEVKLEHMKEMFINFIKNDILGAVSNAHLAQADRLKDGAGSRVCLELARQASIAVDFVKTSAFKVANVYGQSMFALLQSSPQNMMRNEYRSSKVLGTLFDLVHPDAGFHPLEWHNIAPADRVDRRLAPFVIPASIIDDAYRLKQEYDTAMYGTMARYGITEPEAVAGIVLRNPKRRRGREYDLKDSVEQNYKTLCEDVLEAADEFLATRKFKAGGLTMRQVYAVAAYQVTYIDEVRAAAEERLGVKALLSDFALETRECDACGKTASCTRDRGKPNQPSSDEEQHCTASPQSENGLSNSDKNHLCNGSATGTANGTIRSQNLQNGSAGSLPNDDAIRTPTGCCSLKPNPLISFPWVFWEELCDLPNVRGSGPVIADDATIV